MSAIDLRLTPLEQLERVAALTPPARAPREIVGRNHRQLLARKFGLVNDRNLADSSRLPSA